MYLMYLLRFPVSSKNINVKGIIFSIRIFERGRLISCPLTVVTTPDQICILKLSVLSNIG